MSIDPRRSPFMQAVTVDNSLPIDRAAVDLWLKDYLWRLESLDWHLEFLHPNNASLGR